MLKKRCHPKSPRESGHLSVSRRPAPRTADINALTGKGQERRTGGERDGASRGVQEPGEMLALNVVEVLRSTALPYVNYSRYWNHVESGSPCSTSSLPPTLPLPSRMVI